MVAYCMFIIVHQSIYIKYIPCNVSQWLEKVEMTGAHVDHVGEHQVLKAPVNRDIT